MRNFILALGVLAVFSATTGCAGLSFSSRGVAFGTLYVDEVGPNQTTGNAVGTKEGEACSTSILGIAVTGDSSIKTAADAGGISKIGTVNHHYTNMLGLFAKYCTIVTGK